VKDRDATEGTGAHVALMIGARFLSAIMSAAIGLVVPRLLDRSDYGDYGIAIGVAATLVVLSDLGLTTSVARAMAEGRVTSTLLRRIALLRAASALVFACALAAVGTGLAMGGGDHARLGGYLQLASLVVLTSSGLGVAMGLLPTLRKVRGLLVITTVQPLLELTAISAVLVAGLGGSGVIVASACAAAVTGVGGLALVVRAMQGREATAEPASVRAIARYGTAMFLVAISFTVFGQVDQIVIYTLRGSDEAAGYIATWRLVTLLHMVGLAAATIVAPRLAGGGARARAVFDGWLRTLVTGYVFIAAIAAAMAQTAVPAALGDQYRSSAGLLVALSGYTLLLGIAPHVTMAANFLGGARRRIGIGFVTIALNIALDLLLVPWIGAYGAAIGTTVAFGWYVLAHLRLTWGLLGPPMSVAADGSRVPGTFGVQWVLRSLAAAAIGAGTGRIGLLLLEPLVGDVLAVLVAGIAAMAAATFTAWGHPRNAAPLVPHVIIERSDPRDDIPAPGAQGAA
jgi:O-antigen/teichoic acid export membrane protein